MRFLKKYWLALTAAILSAALLVGLGGWLIPRAIRQDYYPRWVMDEAALLSEKTKTAFAELNAELDRRYDSILAVVTTETLNGESAASYLYDRWDTYGFGQKDFALLLVRDGQWFLGDGDAMANYSGRDNALRDCAAAMLSQGEDADALLQELAEIAPDWYRANVPTGSGTSGRAVVVTGGGFLGALGWTFLLLIAGLLLFRNLIYPLFAYENTGRWVPFCRRRKTHSNVK